MTRKRNNPILIKEARNGLNQLRFEVAEELGIKNFNDWDNIDRGQKIVVGQQMSKKLVEKGMQVLMEKYSQG